MLHGEPVLRLQTAASIAVIAFYTKKTYKELRDLWSLDESDEVSVLMHSVLDELVLAEEKREGAV